ncbi:pilus assembly protein TadG-related protein [Roseovarius nanhaiticus]|uniref:pilus assembly protein TadG-related protein n=1 Tax=Roseovarius nanhaiticus TaxID=573024 RepID=UPI0024934A9D|nr:pilus assembly protein TadG-related protein [Roseovarius nanhaiticus]
MPTDLLARFAKDDDGAVAVIVSLLLTVLLGFVAFGVDIAWLYRERAQLQSVSDLTVMSVVAKPENAASRATQALSGNARSSETLDVLQTGRFLRNPAIAPQDRFAALPEGSAGINAARVVLRHDAPLHFARIFTDQNHVTLDRTAIASRTGAASFSLTSHLVHLDGAALNDVLAQQFGVSATLSLGDMTALAGANVDLETLLGALGVPAGANPADILNAVTSGRDLIAALQSTLPQGLASRLGGLASSVGDASFAASSLVGGIDTDLGLTATDFLSQIEISALDVVKSLVATETAGDALNLDTSVTLPGVLSVETALTAGEPPARSGWIALGEEGVQLHRAAVRLRSDISVQPSLLGNLGVGVQVASVHLPIHTELAGSAATLEQISCNRAQPQDVAARFRTGPTPLHPSNGTSVAALYLGTLPETSGPANPAQLGFADLLDVNIVIAIPLLPDLKIPGIAIQARSHVKVGQSRTETISFTHEDVANGATSRTFGSGNLLSSAVGDLLSPGKLELRVKPGQEGLIAGLATPLIDTLLTLLPGRLLSGVASPVDGVLDAILAATGLELGAGELTLTGHHCEPIRLVR